ncbi:formate dehydrogenase subunit gamma [uncultured Sulfitobacter sp.]|uniref:formate dehydrogenase subunit gamma n=1 Tax=uncultured Sulfitobacter sp. TaxID=191468 RepID=UPI0030D9E8CB|tara:strand:- start:35726 stop:36940 length:1215 start_codon:yes stop_codon:yes gene_type:complete
MHRLIAAFLICLPVLFGLSVASGADAQTNVPPQTSTVDTNPAVSKLDDILRRQEGLKTADDAVRATETGDPDNAMPSSGQLGTLGGASDADLWRAFRFGKADISTQARVPAATTLIQDGGMWWLDFRRGPLQTIAVYLLGGTLLALALFYLVRGRIPIEGEKTGRTLLRFQAFERFGHWMLASSFVLLGITGLISLFGRTVIIPALGHEAFSSVAIVCKWVHNNVSWAFMIALIFVFVIWVVHNIPDRTDLRWLAKGGGLLGGGHPPAKKFNAGQKLIFWAVILLGGSISLSGLSLLFPFEFNLFGHTFSWLNGLGAPGWFGFADLPYPLAPQEEMQYAQLWHALISVILTAIIFAHIYLGTIGMEGAFDAMGKGEVEEQWAREHHSIWAEEIAGPKTTARKEP